jgi:hypothetical protein
MSNILTYLDMSSKHVHFYPKMVIISNNGGGKKLKTGKVCLQKYCIDSQVYKKYIASHHLINTNQRSL